MPETLDVGAFKHVLVPIGVIIGLAVARLVSAVSSYVQHRDRVRFSVAHGVWSLAIFFLFVGLWWIAWGFRHVDAERWSFFTLIFLMVGPCLMYLASSLLLPDLPEEGELDLGTPLERLGRPFFLSLIGFILWLAAAESWLLDEPWLVLPKRAFQGTGLLIFAIGATFPSRRMAAWLAAIALPLVIVALATVRAKLG
jgi:hypothetical protein